MALSKGAHSTDMKTLKSRHTGIAALLALFVLVFASVGLSAPTPDKSASSAVPSPERLKEADALRADETLPTAKWVPRRPGFVYSPYAGGGTRPVDVQGVAPNIVVKCPYTGKAFRVPEPLETEKPEKKVAPVKPAAKPAASPAKKPEVLKPAEPAKPTAPADAKKPSIPTTPAGTQVPKARPVTEKAEPAPDLKRIEKFNFPFILEDELFVLVSKTKQAFYVLRRKGPDAVVLFETPCSTGRSVGIEDLQTPGTYRADGKVGYATIGKKTKDGYSKKFDVPMPWHMEVVYSIESKETSGIGIHQGIVWAKNPGVTHGCVRLPEMSEEGAKVAETIFNLVPEKTKVIVLGDAKKIADNGGLNVSKYVVWKTVEGKDKALFKIQTAEATEDDFAAFKSDIFDAGLMQYRRAEKGTMDKSKIFVGFSGIEELKSSLSVAELERLYRGRGPFGSDLTVNIPPGSKPGDGSVGRPVSRRE